MDLLTDFQRIDGIYFPKTDKPEYAASKSLWEDAAEAWEKTGYGAHKPGGIWKKFPEKCHFSTIVDLGCGYGRHAIYLAEERGVTCDRYYGTDIAEVMLRRLLKCKAHFDFFASAEMNIICMPLKTLPIPDNTVDLVYSSSVFMHLNEEDIISILGEIYRVLKPAGSFIFNDSFHNKNCPSYQISNLFRKWTTPDFKTMYLRQYSVDEIETIMANSRIAEKTASYTISPSQYEAIPGKLQKFIPGGKLLNDRLLKQASSEAKYKTYASAYSVYSDNLGL